MPKYRVPDPKIRWKSWAPDPNQQIFSTYFQLTNNIDTEKTKHTTINLKTNTYSNVDLDMDIYFSNELDFWKLNLVLIVALTKL